ncbi:hypothetical protein GCM10023210_17050 [Chryseobacterium ginsengisoli]|uniref:Uncharacterized protein n=1 Tax=Chryseobacterium ginsengisoli TaxID=363853 RepID=A0ABP9M3V8_9FLAO
MISDKEYNLQDFEMISLEPYVYRLFKNEDILLMEVTCGSHGLWQVWIKLNEEETLLYKNEGELGLKKTAKLFSQNCYNPIYHRRYIKVNE